MGEGECAEAMGDYSGAIKKYKELLDKYPRSELRGEAEGRIAVSINKRHPTPDYTEAETEEAQKRIKAAKDEAAAEDVDVDVAALEEYEKVLADRQARKRYEQGVFYAKNGHYRAAEVYLELVKERYPESPWAGKAAEELVTVRKR